MELSTWPMFCQPEPVAKTDLTGTVTFDHLLWFRVEGAQAAHFSPFFFSTTVIEWKEKLTFVLQVINVKD